MVLDYLVVCYAILVKSDRASLEKEEGKIEVPDNYKIAVAEYLATE